MKEIKNKKTGRIVDVLTEEQYAKMLRDAPAGYMGRFIVTDLYGRPIVPSLKTIKRTVIPTKIKKDEG